MIWLFCGIGLLFIILAIPLLRRKIRPNLWYGLRVPATLENEAVWYEANSRSARDLVTLGVITIVAAVGLWFVPWANPSTYTMVCCGLVTVGGLGCGVKGIRVAQQVKRDLSSRQT